MKSVWQDFFSGKRVTQLGLGLLGRGVHDALFLSTYVEHLTVTDMKSGELLTESTQKLIEAGRDNVSFVLGEHRFEDFEDIDFVLKGAGVPLSSPYVAYARERNIPIYMDEVLFETLKPAGVQTIGITGTRGKTTTTMLLHHILKTATQSGKHSGNVFLGGNIRGIATLPLLEKVTDGDVVVEELSSWQLQGFGEASISPTLSIFTNFFEDHLNYYQGSMEAYFLDKSYIFANHTEEDILIMSTQAKEMMQKYWAGTYKGLRIVVDAQAYPELLDFFILPGEHNKQNAVLAIAAAKELGVDDETIIDALRTFHGAPGRLEKVATKNIEVFNDATSTTPIALRVALETLSPKAHDQNGKLILICGGAGKELSIEELPKILQQYADKIITIPGTGTDALTEALDSNQVEYVRVGNIREAVIEAKALAEQNDIILFSPGFASFGEFKNEFDRNDQFLALVAEQLL